MTRTETMRGATLALCLLFALSAAAQTADKTGVEEKPAAADYQSKLTLALYRSGGVTKEDVNLRHQFGAWTGWLGVFRDPSDATRGRAGLQYNWQQHGVLLVPSLEVGTSGYVAGSLYSELGAGSAYGIAGYTRTNLKPLQDIAFDPNDSVQLGAGWRNDRERITAASIFDVRLHTHQQNTHVIWRHKFDARSALTIDAIYKSGRLDSGRTIHAVGLGLYYDHAWFAKLYYDPYVNFGPHPMIRLSFGKKF